MTPFDMGPKLGGSAGEMEGVKERTGARLRTLVHDGGDLFGFLKNRKGAKKKEECNHFKN
ncbi:MAG: hypothetical protein IID13_06390 [Candidatus Marinimicrobia bacterium]|nr:hypothetical protein [Candidatus Neomarinimicrobiota bacterium]